MQRYIDAEKAKEQLLTEYPLLLKEKLIATIDGVPTEDVQKVKHGTWVPNKYIQSIFYCSECGRHIEDNVANQAVAEYFPYCHCGARMDGDC